MSERRMTIAVVWAVSLTLMPLAGCGGCDDAPPPAPKVSTESKPGAANGAEGSAAALSAAAGPHRLAAGWWRATPLEPSPEARGLYRRAIERTHAGAPDEAARLFNRIRDKYADSRFASRLKGGGDPAATAALLGLAATVGAATFVGAMNQLERAGVDPKALPTPKVPGGGR